MESERANGQNQFRRDLAAIAPELKRYAIKITGNKADGEDLAQQTILRALEAEAQFEMGTNLKGWTLTILRNTNLDRIRNRKNRAMKLARQYHPDTSTAPNQEPALILSDTLRALKKLPTDQADAVVKSAMGDSQLEQAKLKQVPEGTIKSRIVRGREALKLKQLFI